MGPLNRLTTFAYSITSQAGCDVDRKATAFFGLPKWYAYLPYTYNANTQHCEITVSNLTQYWLIGVAVIEILLRVVGFVAVGYIIYGGIKYVLSQGEPENAKNALHTIINALIGLTIAIIASGLVAFVANRLT